MKSIPILLVAICVIVPQFSDADEAKGKSVTVTSKLEQGFGKMIEIEGLFIETPVRGISSSKESIRVYWINNKKVDPPILISVSTLMLVGDENRPEVGDWTRLRGFESGGFGGFPKDSKSKSVLDTAFSKSPRMEFKFRTYFRPLEALKTKNAYKADAVQPATAVDSKVEGSEKIKPESEGRSQ